MNTVLIKHFRKLLEELEPIEDGKANPNEKMKKITDCNSTEEYIVIPELEDV